ncbi:MAG: sugar transporter [Mesosutterella sp.]|nr:sugar transporter [Mesosutterella sp.]
MDTVNQGRTGLRAWLPLAAMACSVFAFNSSEFMPIGLLSDIASDFGIATSKAGLLITFYAWGVCVMSVPLMVLCSRMEYRKLLAATVALFAVSHVLSALSTGYWMLMASRVGVACAHSVFWAIAPPVAVKVAPEGRRATALSVIAASTSVALIAGLPLGRTIGLVLGWRCTFGAVAVVAFLILAFILREFPRVPNTSYVAPEKIPGILRKPVLVAIFAVTVLTVTAQFCGYSYIEPFLTRTAHLSESAVTWVLMLYGAAGIASSVLYSRLYDANRMAFRRFAILGIASSLLLLYLASHWAAAVVALCAFWGIAVMVFNLVFQSLIIEEAPPAAVTIAMAAYSGIYNLGIGSGAFIGGRVEQASSVAWVGLCGGLVALIAALVFFRKLAPRLHS